MTNTGTSLVFHGYDGSRLEVDSATGQVGGSWIPRGGAARLDFMTPAELCRCCAQELLQSGSRWSTWFCADCRPRVRGANEHAAYKIPIGRHSLVNGLVLSDPTDDAAVVAFTRAWQLLTVGMERTQEWTRERLRRNCAALGWPPGASAPLGEYLDAVGRNALSRERASLEMLEWWARSVS